MVAPQTVVSMRCTTNQRNIVCQSNDALKAIYGAGTDLIMLENKRKSENADLTRLEKSDSSRDFFSCLDFVGDRGDFFEFFRIMFFLLTIFCENGGRTLHLGQNLTENRLGAFLEPVGTSNSVVSHVQCPKLQINVLKRKSAALKKYGGKSKNGGPIFFCGMCGVIFSWTDGEDPG